MLFMIDTILKLIITLLSIRILTLQALKAVVTLVSRLHGISQYV